MTDSPDTQDNLTTGASDKRGVAFALALLVGVLVLAGAAYVLLSGQGKSSQPTDLAAVAASDEDLPHLADYDATVLSELGDSTPLTKIADGKPLVINFWATWCPYCIDEMDDFQAIYDDYRDWVSFAFVDATDGTQETIEDARAWLEAHDYDMPFYYDIRREAVANFGVSAYPTTVVVSAAGDILTISPGRIDAQLMRSALDSLR